jgi:tetratricopeptide (TPR) repeat protein
MVVTQDQLSWYNVSEDVKTLLILASNNWENTILAEQYIHEALKKAENNLDVLTGAYRFFFYKKKSKIALEIAKKILKIIEETENLPLQWEQLKPILANRQYDSSIRLYINAYAAQGFILAKLGQLEEAKLITKRVKEIDKNRESCAATVFEVLTKSLDEDDY